MKQKNLFLLIITIAFIAIVLGLIFIQFGSRKPDSPPTLGITKKDTAPSQTSIEYTDPAGFSFSYPDNLSIQKADTEDPDTYTDLQLFSKDVNGSIKLKIADTKLASASAWLKSNNIPATTIPAQRKLGNLDALEAKTSDRLLLGAIDQKVLFTIEVPLVEEQFWMKVYEKLLSEFTFVSPEAGSLTTSAPSESEVFFEGEEVVE